MLNRRRKIKSIKVHKKLSFSRKRNRIQKFQLASYFPTCNHEGIKHVENAPIVYKDGGGKLQGACAPKEYQEMKKARIEYIDGHFSRNKSGRGYTKTMRKDPWYKLVKGKCYNYETRHFEWGDATKNYRVKSEAAMMYEKTLMHKPTVAERMNDHIDYKLSKWEARNPKPCGDDDMFKEQYIPQWEENRKLAKEAIVKSVCKKQKLEIWGRYENTIDKGYFETKLTSILDKKNELPTFSCDEDTNLRRQVEKTVKREMSEYDNFVCCNLKTLTGETILVVPKAA